MATREDEAVGFVDRMAIIDAKLLALASQKIAIDEEQRMLSAERYRLVRELATE